MARWTRREILKTGLGIGRRMSIVQALKQPGEITIEAHATGLESALATINARPAMPRPTI